MPRPMHGNANEFWSNSAKAGGGRGPSVYFRGAPVDAASPAESLLHYNLLYCICVHVLMLLPDQNLLDATGKWVRALPSLAPCILGPV